MFIDSKFLEQLSAGLAHANVPDGASLIVAFSGGPDSSALLAGLSKLAEQRNFKLLSAHVNHKIRPESSDHDQLRARQISESLGLEFIVSEVDARAVAKSRAISIELAAREARYNELSKLVVSRSALGVVTGHTRDDQAETVLLHASRGSGLKGIAGMSVRSTLKLPGSSVGFTIIRPMLGISKVDCALFCSQIGIVPVSDESNESRVYTRNRIRLDVLPRLAEVVPGATEALARLAENVSSDLEIVDWTVENYLADLRGNPGHYLRSRLTGLPRSLIARILMRTYEDHLGHGLDLEQKHVSAMVDLVIGQSGTSLDLPNRVLFFVDRDTFGFRSAGDDDCPFPDSITSTTMTVPGTTRLDKHFSVTAEIVPRPESLKPDSRWATFASPELQQLMPSLRNRKDGDRFQPLGMEPRVKLQDFFVGEGVPERWRGRVPIVESAKGIAWVSGSRVAEWAKVQPHHDVVIRLELIKAD
ncbi:MAG: tRNA lysidine(34) synthetase TilS [Chloroflexi bacterium]|nr:tRNA lysidine(34) synthetase TilS [Chloroflexota bacterium]